MALKETQEKLRQWGLWLYADKGIGYTNVLGALQGGGLPLAPISDDYAMAIDRVVAVLKRTNVEQYSCIKLSYGRRMSNASIARQLGIGRMVVQRRIESAERWIDTAFTIEKV